MHKLVVLLLFSTVVCCFAMAQNQPRDLKKLLPEHYVFFDSVGLDRVYFIPSKNNSLKLDKALPVTARNRFDKSFEDSNLICLPDAFEQLHHPLCNVSVSQQTNLSNLNEPQEIQLSSPAFVMAKNEVSNKQYREFVHYVLDSVKRELLIKEGVNQLKLPTDKYDFTGRNYRLNYSVSINEADSVTSLKLRNSGYYFPNDERFYKRLEIDSRLAVYTYQEENGTIQSVAVFPDTLCWINDFPLAYSSEALSMHYFRHPGYQDYPVVGVSYHQALAYIHFINEKNKKANLGISFRLPSSFEYEAIMPELETLRQQSNETIAPQSKRNDHRYRNKLKEIKPLFYANYGGTKINGIINFTSPSDDGCIFTCPVFFFNQSTSLQPNIRLNNCAGNVAEWTSSSISLLNSTIPSVMNTVLYLDNEINTSNKQLQINPENNGILDGVYLAEEEADEWYHQIEANLRASLESDRQLIGRLINNAVVKGGSWAQSPLYLEKSVTSIYDKSAQKSYIGFRLAATVDSTKLGEFNQIFYQKKKKK